jgi:hypothetical protein
MCPACIGAAAWAVAGTTSAGGLTALLVGIFRRKSKASSKRRGGAIDRHSHK